jgi:Rrf2 family transcriptional regulator, repressor of oqxAB
MGLLPQASAKEVGCDWHASPKRSRLRDIYLTVTDEKKLWVARSDVPCQCVASANIVQFFERLAGEAEGLVLQMLASRTVADSVTEIRKLEMARLGGYAAPRTTRNA